MTISEHDSVYADLRHLTLNILSEAFDVRIEKTERRELKRVECEVIDDDNGIKLLTED